MSSVEGSSLLRVVRPEPRYMPTVEVQDDEKSRLLSKICGSFREACDRLVVRERRVASARLFAAGVCIGLLDPVSNVMANAEATTDIHESKEAVSAANAEEKLREMGHRSLDGLVAFLVYFFPYTPVWEAVRYLLLADADLLVAVRLVAADRGMVHFSLTSAASEWAFKDGLRFAAETANHPDPQRLVDVWMSLSCRLQQAQSLICEVQAHSPREDTYRLRDWLLQKQGRTAPQLLPTLVLDLGQCWYLAASRPPDNGVIANSLYQHTRSLRMVLLDTIRGFYLQALARLPRDELRHRYHRSLIMGGHCYGPMDPVSNIIINTIWHDVAFPAARRQPVLDMIAPHCLTRIESRSFYGLVSFLQTRYQDLSEHEVVQRLIASYGTLSIADPKLNDATTARAVEEWKRNTSRTSMLQFCATVRKVEQQSPYTSVQEAYVAAATAAWHPKPEAQAEFLGSVNAVLHGPALLMLQSSDCLTSADVQYIASLLAPEQPYAPERTKKNPYPTLAAKLRSEAQQRRICRRVTAALDRYLLPNGEPAYKLHVICGANENVSGPEYCTDEEDALSAGPCKFRYTHVNILVTQQGSRGGRPDLLFAEFDNEKEDAPILCCYVNVPTPFAEHVRCLYCEKEGAKVVHPAMVNFHGGGEVFEEMIRNNEPMRNGRLISRNEYAVQSLCAHDEDFMYVDVKLSRR